MSQSLFPDTLLTSDTGTVIRFQLVNVFNSVDFPNSSSYIHKYISDSGGKAVGSLLILSNAPVVSL